MTVRYLIFSTMMPEGIHDVSFKFQRHFECEYVRSLREDPDQYNSDLNAGGLHLGSGVWFAVRGFERLKLAYRPLEIFPSLNNNTQHIISVET